MDEHDHLEHVIAVAWTGICAVVYFIIKAVMP